MLSLAPLRVVGLVLLALPVHRAFTEEPPREPARQSVRLAGIPLSRIGEMAQAASDLRKVVEACERLANTLAGLAETVANSLATMSSEFDPFGYKTAFRTIRHQSEMLQQQRDIIRGLQEREIDRLRIENQRLKEEVKILRERKRKPARK